MASREELGLSYKPELPIPISCVGDRYLIFDVKVMGYLRREHRICGMMVGTLPQSPSQNIFLGLPVQIMPEEAQLLVETGIGFVVDDAAAHNQVLTVEGAARRADYLARINKESRRVEQLRTKEKEESRRQAMSKRKAKLSNDPGNSTESATNDLPDAEAKDETDDKHSETIFLPTDGDSGSINLPTAESSGAYSVTLATSRLLLPDTPAGISKPISNLPASYPLYRHLNSQGYFTTPGLRFGCQYTVYPGDPLRFHSHFLAVGIQWDEEINLMDIVGGGRLGTGVKKGYLIGGEDPKGNMKTFSVEWAAM